jgi:hypothetical protein
MPNLKRVGWKVGYHNFLLELALGYYSQQADAAAAFDPFARLWTTTMSSAYPVQPSRQYIPHIRSQCSNCNVQVEFPVPSPTPAQGTLLRIRCFKCQSTYTHAFYPTQLPPGYSNTSSSTPPHNPIGSGSTPPSNARKGRKIGTQEKPLETGYYDLLGVPIDASTDDIKKSYRTVYLDWW